MAEPARRLITAAEFVDMVFDPVLGGSPELWDGELFYRALPRFRHGNVQNRFGRVLGELEPDDADAPGWWFAIEPDWQITELRVLKPDVAGWRRERMPDPPDGVVEIAPDWICEVVSPSHEAHDLKFKADVYREHGVPWYWLLFPEARLLQVLRNNGATWEIVGTQQPGEVLRLPPFEELELAVGRLFTPVRTPSATAGGGVRKS